MYLSQGYQIPAKEMKVDNLKKIGISCNALVFAFTLTVTTLDTGSSRLISAVDKVREGKGRRWKK